jgi:D-proline reductase (dithiol) PrdB
LVARVLEEQGIATVTLAAMRDVVEAVKPPRAVLLKFPFGSPLGRPGDADKQSEVIKTALSLLETADAGGVIAEPDIRYSSQEVGEKSL